MSNAQRGDYNTNRWTTDDPRIGEQKAGFNTSGTNTSPANVEALPEERPAITNPESQGVGRAPQCDG